ncbi:MAG: NAD(P)/FAD-dependent oxidoreductase [Rhizobiaceae bacterium]|nr:NAD(P)/FAD-dependent oxidoreductase [Rhizobiaceae bacterium]
MRIAVIGAGASGIAAGVNLRKGGYEDFVVFEKAAELGGTWRDNTYPGVACDVPSHLYRFSFAPKADWSMEYAPGSEIHDYLRKVAEDFGILQHIRFNTELTRVEFVDGMWHLASNRGDEGVFNVVISAMGVLHKEVYPSIAGRESFAGISFHSSKWRHDVSLEGKRVGIIGAGSTSVQILPSIVDKVEQVALFMRTPQWVFPVDNNPIPAEKKALFASDPSKLQSLYDYLGDRLNRRLASALVGLNEEGLREISDACARNLEDNVQDPELRKKLTPDYAVGCKRLVVSSAFYPAIQKPNADLIMDSIEAIVPEGIRTADGVLHPLDIIIYATGFDPFNFHRPVKVIGRSGADLDDVWSEAAYALRSISVPGFPNMFFIGGPNSPIGNFSFLLTAETQIRYIMGLVAAIDEGDGSRLVEPKSEATEAFNHEIELAMKDTVWVTGGCTSWYFDKHGKVASWPWTYERFENELSEPRLTEYVLS